MGKRKYETTTEHFEDCFDFTYFCANKESLPKYLWFGKNNIATNGQDIFAYDAGMLCFNDDEDKERHFKTLVLNRYQTLVLIIEVDEKNIYHKYGNVDKNVYLCDKI